MSRVDLENDEIDRDLVLYDYFKNAVIVTTIITTSEVARRAGEILWPNNVTAKIMSYIIVTLLLFTTLIFIMHKESNLLIKKHKNRAGLANISQTSSAENFTNNSSGTTYNLNSMAELPANTSDPMSDFDYLNINGPRWPGLVKDDPKMISYLGNNMLPGGYQDHSPMYPRYNGVAGKLNPKYNAVYKTKSGEFVINKPNLPKNLIYARKMKRIGAMNHTLGLS